jgi:hypothetical protein
VTFEVASTVPFFAECSIKNRFSATFGRPVTEPLPANSVRILNNESFPFLSDSGRAPKLRGLALVERQPKIIPCDLTSCKSVPIVHGEKASATAPTHQPISPMGPEISLGMGSRRGETAMTRLQGVPTIIEGTVVKCARKVNGAGELAPSAAQDSASEINGPAVQQESRSYSGRPVARAYWKRILLGSHLLMRQLRLLVRTARARPCLLATGFHIV